MRLIERGHVGAGATVASFGNIRRTGRALEQLPLAKRALDLWSRADELLGRDVEFRATGHLRLIFDEASRTDMLRFAEAARPLGLELDQRSPQRSGAAFPTSAPRQSAPASRPATAAPTRGWSPPAFADAASRAGAEIIAHAGEPGVEKTETGFQLGPGTGDTMAELIATGTSTTPVAAMSITRFAA